MTESTTHKPVSYAKENQELINNWLDGVQYQYTETYDDLDNITHTNVYNVTSLNHFDKLPPSAFSQPKPYIVSVDICDPIPYETAYGVNVSISDGTVECFFSDYHDNPDKAEWLASILRQHIGEK